jgi:hypothetical protein
MLTQLYSEHIEDWRLLKCARAYARDVDQIRNAKLVRLLQRILARVRVRMNDEYRRARSKLKTLSQVRKLHVGVWGSAGLKGDLLRAYLALKNGALPAEFMIDLYNINIC